MSVDAGDVLLQVDLVLVAEAFVAVDLLFQHAQPVASHDDLVEECIDGNFLGFDGSVAGLEYECASLPFITEGNCLGQAAPETKNF